MGVCIFYSPTNSNRRIVPLLKQRPGLRECEFIELAGEKTARAAQLIEISRSVNPVAFIWGDGWSHDESHDFTKHSKDAGIGVKTNIDRHSDKGTTRRPLDCGNHMSYTEMDGIEIVGPILLQRGSDDFLDELDITLAARSSKAIAITHDCDGLRAFPCKERWVFNFGFTLEKILQIIRKTGQKLLRFDVGGLIEDISEFELLPEGSFKYPDSEETLRIVTSIEKPIAPIPARGPPPKELTDRVCSYAVEVYGNLLEAFVQAVSGIAVGQIGDIAESERSERKAVQLCA